MVNAVIGWNFDEKTISSTGYTITGFASDEHRNPAFSAGFKEGYRPSYAESISRSTSFFFNGNYSYDNKYLIDLNLRADATSKFGSNKLFDQTWAIGLAWNLHNEKFIKNLEFVNHFKIRASVGNPGNQNFDPYLSYKTYKYNIAYQNVFGPSAIIDKFGNNDLKWQRAIDKNIGFDINLFNNTTNPFYIN